ncbi:HAD family hydrolase [Stutzerimonas kirkiae]|uniref:HAD family hydrolase n=1 Tax=Stutzerimonas kirkiae TaxID=2211392 RepID=A0A4Q9R5E9_9GAMM|nr:HAD-IA family hydrolase [Stutzerimonas kirkiae]TBU95756.1 HAD family hydrolase [Stutzerimonas kirkiae]TBV02747.1 HAD family hydrolase [Stutzerimonas kirkiae]TBV03205.1 HAD family hydrolase [Stutzerimonas kirkiae]TBV13260.1 HAD family hydrolase [Stutzerimonas kirkiae]
MKIQLLTFDLDDTLWDNRPVIANAEQAMRDWLRRHAPASEGISIEHFRQVRQQVLDEQPLLRHRLSSLRRQTLQRVLREDGYEDSQAMLLAEGAFQAMLEARHRIELFSDTLPTLETLASRYRLAVITNGNADIHRLGLGDYFSFTLCAEELGVGKPDPRPFREALRRAGVEAQAAVHIGDDPANDIAGAQDVGMRAVWFNPSGQGWPLQGGPDARVAALAELPGTLHKLEA